jgi:hypothetical protein
MRWLSQPSELPCERLAAELLAAGVPVDYLWISEDPAQEDDEVGIGERLHVQSHSAETFFEVVESDSMRAVCQTDDVGAAVTFVAFYLGIRQ